MRGVGGVDRLQVTPTTQSPAPGVGWSERPGPVAPGRPGRAGGTSATPAGGEGRRGASGR